MDCNTRAMSDMSFRTLKNFAFTKNKYAPANFYFAGAKVVILEDVLEKHLQVFMILQQLWSA